MQVLSNPQRRQVYDEDGEEGLKDMPPAGGCSNPPRNAEDIFAEFFGSSPFGFRAGGSDGNSSMPKKPPPVESKLPCTLEELYSGSTRKMKISRTVVDANGYVRLNLTLTLKYIIYFKTFTLKNPTLTYNYRIPGLLLFQRREGDRFMDCNALK